MAPGKIDGWVGWISPLFHAMPYIDQANVYNQVDQTQYRVRSQFPNNLFLKNVSIPAFKCPSDPGAGSGPTNNYRLNWGPISASGRNSGDGLGAEDDPWFSTVSGELDGALGGAWTDNGSLDVGKFTDGTSNTILYSERITGNNAGGVYVGNYLHGQPSGTKVVDKNNFQSTTTAIALAACTAATAAIDAGGTGDWRDDFGSDQGDEIPFLYSSFAAGAFNTITGPNSPIYDCGVGSVPDSPNESAIVAARSFHTGTVLAALADGSVRAVSDNIDLGTYQAASTRSGGEVQGEW